mmetsp:Transcript_37488/g.75973  ORF Transcript_37488/g.75973 Transcript_37488/m.75973 type:complete len:127 (+) Transcript_37488:42-422(+)
MFGLSVPLTLFAGGGARAPACCDEIVSPARLLVPGSIFGGRQGLGPVRDIREDNEPEEGDERDEGDPQVHGDDAEGAELDGDPDGPGLEQQVFPRVGGVVFKRPAPGLLKDCGLDQVGDGDAEEGE